MTPFDIIRWALALGIAWLILSSCIPLERWGTSLIGLATKRRKGIAPADSDHRECPVDRLIQAEEVSSDNERVDGLAGDGS